MSGSTPPWPLHQEPPEHEFTSTTEARWYSLQTADLAVTPTAGRAGQAAMDSSGAVFYVKPAEFSVFADEPASLTETTSGSNPRVRRDDILDRTVMRFIDDHIVTSPYLNPVYAGALGNRHP